MVFNDAVVHQGNAPGTVDGVDARAVAEVWVRVVHGGCAVGGPAGMGNAGAPLKVCGVDLFHQLRNPCGAARALQAMGVHRHAAGVITPVFEPGQALYQHGNDVVIGYGADNATHGELL